jgi:CubicO group peptidase (beta-lactamase class C family)
MRTFIALALLLITADASTAERPELNPQTVAAFFDTAFSVQQKDHQIVGAVVSVVQNGEVLFKAGYGFADLESRTSADPDESLFRIASISKLFVWTAIMQLAEQGRLSIDDPVDEYLDIPIPTTYPDPIRIRHLLTHTPGFEEKGVGSSARTIDEVIPLAQHLAEAMPARVRPPGEHASYSNYGTAMAAYIVERVSGQSWADYVDQHILEPLDMSSTNTQLEMRAELKARHATGYRFGGGQFIATDYEFINDVPAGHMSTTADDMTRFMLAHLNAGTYKSAQILERATALKMREALFDPHPGISPMLHGFYRADRNGLEIFGHGGDVNQFHSNVSLIPEHDLGVFVSFNSDSAAGARGNLIVAFIDHFFGDEYLRPAPEPFEMDLEPFSGEYLTLRSNYSTFEKLSMLVNAVTVSAGDNELLLAGGNVSRWIPVADNRFTAKYSNQTMVFERDADGEVSHMVINSPLGTYQRLTGLDSPSLQQNMLAALLAIALLTLVGYSYRGFRRADLAVRLPRQDVVAAWVHSLLLIALYGYLMVKLSGSVDEFSYGMPASAHLVMLLMSFNLLLGLVIAGLSARQWLRALGGTFARVRYGFVAFAAVLNLWICWYFNILAYLFQ